MERDRKSDVEMQNGTADLVTERDEFASPTSLIRTAVTCGTPLRIVDI